MFREPYLNQGMLCSHLTSGWVEVPVHAGGVRARGRQHTPLPRRQRRCAKQLVHKKHERRVGNTRNAQRGLQPSSRLDVALVDSGFDGL